VHVEEEHVSETPVDQLRAALDAVGELIAGITPEMWSRPTPCTDWDVRALVTHLSNGNRMFATALGNDASTPPPTAACGRRGRRPRNRLPGHR
jgi:uncharacterized protein (TIGR03083 family)